MPRVYGRMKSAIRENSVNSKAEKFAKLRRIRVIRATIIPTREKFILSLQSKWSKIAP